MNLRQTSRSMQIYNAKRFNACYKGQTIAAALFLYKNDSVHYFLGTSDIDFLYLRPNNMLFYEAIFSAKQEVYRIFNLGGSHYAGDSLFQFKKSFSNSTADFYTYI